jgi:hypothetical protein
LLGWDFKGAHYLAMLDVSLQWKRGAGAGAGASAMALYELKRWGETHHDYS